MQPNRDRVTKESATDEPVVEWEPRLCFHSQNCVRLLPQVFDDGRQLTAETSVRASQNGPLLLTGGVRVLASDGSVLSEGERRALPLRRVEQQAVLRGSHLENGFCG